MFFHIVSACNSLAATLLSSALVREARLRRALAKLLSVGLTRWADYLADRLTHFLIGPLETSGAKPSVGLTSSSR